MKSEKLSNNQVFRICVFWSRIGPPINECIEMLLENPDKKEIMDLIDYRLGLFCGVLENIDIITSKKLRYHIKKFGLPEDLNFNNVNLDYLLFDGLQIYEPKTIEKN